MLSYHTTNQPTLIGIGNYEKKSKYNATPEPATTTTQLITNESGNSYTNSNYLSQQLSSNGIRRNDATHISSIIRNFEG